MGNIIDNMGSPGNQPTTILSSFYFFIVNGIILLDGVAGQEALGMTILKMVIHIGLTTVGAMCLYVAKDFCKDFYNIKVKPKFFKKNESEKSESEKRA